MGQGDQELFRVATASGSLVTLKVWGTHHTAILKDEQVIETFMVATDAGLDRAFKRYFALVEECGGARHPFQLLDPPANVGEREPRAEPPSGDLQN